MAALVDQLRQLHHDLQYLVERDPEQEVTGIALPLVDAVVSEARIRLPPESTLQRQVVELISPESCEEGNGVRAADALLVVGQLLAATEHYEQEARDRLSREAAPNIARAIRHKKAAR